MSSQYIFLVSASFDGCSCGDWSGCLWVPWGWPKPLWLVSSVLQRSQFPCIQMLVQSVITLLKLSEIYVKPTSRSEPSFQLNHVKMCNAQLRQLLFCFRLKIKDVLLGRKQTVWFDIPIASVAWGWLNYSSINWWGWAFLIRQRSSSMTDCVATQ